jgi:hypothetical protein
MFHLGPRLGNGNIPSDVVAKIDGVLTEFIEIVASKVKSSEIRRAVVRSMLTCNTLNVVDSVHLYVAAQKQTGMPSTISIDRRENKFSIEDILEAAIWEFGFDDPFVIQFPVQILDQNTKIRAIELQAIADSYIQSEVNRVAIKTSTVQINPIFGPAAYAIDPQLAFVLMPFTNDLTGIYNAFVKPTIEDKQFRLICRRADDVKSNKAIMQDIWKSICEARLVVADLSGLNPNVMYELGIAHTLGKETVLIYQRGGDVKFPFDLTHIRRIEYENNALGGKQLENELRQTLEGILTPTIKALP